MADTSGMQVSVMTLIVLRKILGSKVYSVVSCLLRQERKTGGETLEPDGNLHIDISLQKWHICYNNNHGQSWFLALAVL